MAIFEKLDDKDSNRITTLKKAIQEGLDSGRAIDFDPAKHLAELKAKKALKNRKYSI